MSPTGSVPERPFPLVAATLVAQLGSTEQKQRLLPAIAAGEMLVTVALQEGGHHAPQQTAASATREGDHYVINGSKLMVLDATSASVFIVIVRTGGNPGEEQGLSALLVDADTAGLSVQKRSMVSCETTRGMRVMPAT